MFPWGAIIGLTGQAISGGLSLLNNQKMQQAADEEAAREKAFYEAKANENPLSRSENQHILGQYDRAAQQQIENARGVAAITGATPEFSTAVQKAVAEGRADLMGQMGAGASARKDRYEIMGEQVRHRKEQEDQYRRMQRNSTFAALASNAASAAGAIMDGYSAKKAPAKNTLDNNPGAAKTKAAEQSGYADQQKAKLKSGQAPNADYYLAQINSGATSEELGRIYQNMDLSEQQKIKGIYRQNGIWAIG